MRKQVARITTILAISVITVLLALTAFAGSNYAKHASHKKAHIVELVFGLPKTYVIQHSTSRVSTHASHAHHSSHKMSHANHMSHDGFIDHEDPNHDHIAHLESLKQADDVFEACVASHLDPDHNNIHFDPDHKYGQRFNCPTTLRGHGHGSHDDHTGDDDHDQNHMHHG